MRFFKGVISAIPTSIVLCVVIILIVIGIYNMFA